jgi:ABC-type transport system involved in multi-copper enzyme maturation permease subunit
MWKPLQITKEDLYDKKWSILGVGILVGLMGFYVIYLFSSLDFTQMKGYIESLPEAMWILLGGELDLTNPYSLTNAYFYSFMWLYCGIFLVYMASNLVPNNVENHTIDLTLSKPISREGYLMGKIVFVYAFILILMGFITAFIAGGMNLSTFFLEEGLHWERVGAVFLMATLHLGTLAMTAVFASTIFLDSKKTVGVAVIVMFMMFFIGDFSPLMNPSLGKVVQFASTWFYYNPAQFFGAGNFANFLRDVLVLVGINLGLIIASLIVFQKRDIPI